MNITILGAGNGGTTVAVDLKLKGHQVTLLKTSDKLHNEHFNAICKNEGRIILHEEKTKVEATLDLVTTDFSKALTKETELIIIYIQTNYHETLIQKLSSYLHDGQIILIEPGYLSTLYFIKYCPKLDLTIVEAESSPLDCRIVAPAEVSILFRNIRNPIGIYPQKNAEKALNELAALQYNFTLLDSVIESALHNPNLIVHTIGAIMSIPRIEYTDGQYWMYKEVFTSSVWNLVEALDEEKMAVLASFNLKKLSYVEACKFRNSQDLSLDAKTIFEDYAKNSSTKGPFVSNSRYITEDVPEGLVLLETLAKRYNIKTPICTSLINLAGACLQTDFREHGRTIEHLGLEQLNMVVMDKDINV